MKPVFILAMAAAPVLLSILPTMAGDDSTLFRAGSIVVETPWSRATPNGAKVAGGYMRIINTGSEPDRLLGGSTAVAGRFQVHQMWNENGVMRMAPVEGGIIIPPSSTVELKPGGYHAMLTDIREPLKIGDTVKGTLVFENAGTVEITYRVGGIGAQAPKYTYDHR